MKRNSWKWVRAPDFRKLCSRISRARFSEALPATRLGQRFIMCRINRLARRVSSCALRGAFLGTGWIMFFPRRQRQIRRVLPCSDGSDPGSSNPWCARNHRRGDPARRGARHAGCLGNLTQSHARCVARERADDVEPAGQRRNIVAITVFNLIVYIIGHVSLSHRRS